MWKKTTQIHPNQLHTILIQYSHSHHNMTICGLFLHHRNTESCKNLEQKFIFQLGTVHTMLMRSMNTSHSTNLFTNSCNHISTNGKAPPQSINQSIQFGSEFIPVNSGGCIYPSSNLSNSHSPYRSIHGVLFLQAHALALLPHLRLPRLLWSSLLPLASHFKLQRISQNVPIIPPQHMPVPSHSIRLCHLNHCFLQS